ncbi:RluA family pseudouridine synthase [Sediminicurvatus halobius]|uniref:Pseudouridine synthase n=1 Tax=Sediminicurvatus halobius TaxID=2182432 RepID=A0A2U2N2D8_9GAMM|nr:RluA family pseudouridine synthase [Spiribacter halobius]PWG63233.1 23S rRNA pseudouridine(955/2504/2580) synthase [Spiribacter halobius]UEX76696.1 RluA family pseudouridine synthase [Spiribacter halobius]
MPAVQHIEISQDLSGQRIDNYLMRVLKGVPRTRIYRLLRKGEVRVNGRRARPTYRLAAGDRLRLPPVRTGQGAVSSASDHVLERLRASILYEDEHVLVVDKPSGLAVHGGSGLAYGVVEALRQLRPEQPLLDLAHRLDRDTSGCLVLAKRRPALRALHALLRDGQVEKRYLALLHGDPGRQPRVVAEPLARRNGPGGETVMRVAADGKPSRTVFRALSRHAGWTLVEARLETGRMHQIRVHAAHIGHPVAMDPKYGDPEADQALRRLGLKRLFLHAAGLRFQLPGQAVIDVSAPLPPALHDVLRCLGENGDNREGAKGAKGE